MKDETQQPLELLPPPTPRRRTDAVLLLGFTAVALLLRLPNIQESLWLDELHTAWVVQGGLEEMPRRAAIGNHSPIYFLLPWLSVQVFGLNELALRLPSLIAGTALVPGVYLVARRLSGSPLAAFVAASLATFDSDFLYFSSEARQYACVQLVALGQVAALWRVLQGGGWRWRTVWILLTALLFYLHYTAVLLVVAEVVFVVALIPFRAWQAGRLKNFAMDVSAAALLMLPAAWHLLEIADRRVNWQQFITSPDSLASWQLFPLAAYLLVPVLLTYGCLFLQKLTGVARPLQGTSPKLVPILFCLCWLLVPLAVAYFTTRFEIAALWMHRYVMASAAAVMVLASLLAAFPKQLPLRIVFGGLTLLAAIGWAGPHWSLIEFGVPRPPRSENWRDAVALIGGDAEAGEWPVLLCPVLIEADGLPENPEDKPLREYCLLPVRSIYPVESQRTAIPLPTQRPGNISDADFARIGSPRGVWIITRGRPENATYRVNSILKSLRRAGMKPQKTTTHTFGGVRVVRVEFEL